MSVDTGEMGWWASGRGLTRDIGDCRERSGTRANAVAHLHPACRRALSHVAALSTGPPVDATLRITLNFHPDWAAPRQSVLHAMVEDGVYLSQFVTGTSKGGLSAYPGGDRWRWEQRMFGGAYDAVPARQRPVYGALNFRHHPAGAAPRFGSAHLRLTASALARATFCYPDSHMEPTAFAVAERMSLVDVALSDEQDDLDDYIEAQIHGEVRIDRDVEALVLDRCEGLWRAVQAPAPGRAGSSARRRFWSLSCARHRTGRWGTRLIPVVACPPQLGPRGAASSAGASSGCRQASPWPVRPRPA